MEISLEGEQLQLLCQSIEVYQKDKLSSGIKGAIFIHGNSQTERIKLNVKCFCEGVAIGLYNDTPVKVILLGLINVLVPWNSYRKYNGDETATLLYFLKHCNSERIMLRSDLVKIIMTDKGLNTATNIDKIIEKFIKDKVFHSDIYFEGEVLEIKEKVVTL